jgi:NAD(P)-dependent dehydrogenase (short-subunit alcohol dehydrogenase family)
MSNGVIHNVSSTVGTSGFTGLDGYTSAKGAIKGLTRTLRGGEIGRAHV